MSRRSIHPAVRRRALDLAEKVGVTAAGSLTGVDRNTIARWQRQEAVRAARENPPTPTSALEARDAFADWIVDRIDVEAELTRLGLPVEDGLERIGAALEFTHRGLIRAANRERTDWEREHRPATPHRLAILAWFSGDRSTPAEDTLEWAQALTETWLRTHGSLTAWHEAELAAIAEEQRALAEVPMPPDLPDLIARAEAVLAEDPDAA